MQLFTPKTFVGINKTFRLKLYCKPAIFSYDHNFWFRSSLGFIFYPSFFNITQINSAFSFNVFSLSLSLSHILMAAVTDIIWNVHNKMPCKTDCSQDKQLLENNGLILETWIAECSFPENTLRDGETYAQNISFILRWTINAVFDWHLLSAHRWASLNEVLRRYCGRNQTADALEFVEFSVSTTIRHETFRCDKESRPRDEVRDWLRGRKQNITTVYWTATLELKCHYSIHFV